MFEQKRLGDNGTSAATAKESGDRGDKMDEKDGQVAHLAIVPISTSVTRLGTRWDLCDKSGIRHRHVNLSSAWECSRNDVFEGLAVLGAAAAVWIFDAGWPDVIIAAALLVMFLRSAGRVFRTSLREMQFASR